MSPIDPSPLSAHAWLEGGGETGALVRSIDWSKTPLGAIESWPPSLKTTVGTILHSRHPMFLWWGKDLIQIYNDGYLPSFGKGKHPVAMGQRGEDCWQEVWPIIGPQIDDVMAHAKASWNEDQLVPVWRNERIEEVYWTYGYSPVFAESGAVGGALVVCIETTSKVLAKRRLGALRTLAQRTAVATTTEEVLAAAANLFETTTSDIPFAMIYARHRPTSALAISHVVGLGDAQRDAIDDACRPTFDTREKQAPIDLAKIALDRALPGGPWTEPSTQLFVTAIGDAENERGNLGFVVFGLSPRLTFDDAYRDHLTQLSDHIALSLSRIEGYRAKDEFFAMLGHELRNPLAPIVTALHLMKEHDDGKVKREQEIIERQVGHLTRLVDDLLDVSRIARGKVTLKKELVEISAIVADAVEMASNLLEQHRHQLSIALPLEGARVEGDPVRLAQVVGNLLINAARYTEPGGKISIRAESENAEVVLAVKDTGIGIDPDLLPRVFDLFVQGRRTTDRKEGGLGVGLALVKSFATMHGGKVAVRSEGVGRGSEFEVRLPLAATPDETSDRTASTSPGTRAKRVLVVDDNVDSAEMMMMMLQSVGHEVTVAHDGAEALRAVQDFSPDVALLDIGLPEMDGYELGKRLHATPHAASCKLIALTGYGQAHDRAQSKASGFAEHLVKPVDMKNLLRIISE